MSDPIERESGLLTAMVEFADTIIGDFDIVEITALLVESCVSLLAVDAAGLVLADGRGGLQVMASTTEATHRVETHQINVGEGPCVEAFRSGSPRSEPDLAGTDRWPRFTPLAREVGYRAVHALPMALREQVIGAVNLFGTTAGPLSVRDRRAAEALTHMATVAVLQYRTLHESHRLNQQLQGALSSRIVVEQAKGRLFERGQLATPDDAFALLRAYSRRTNRRITDVAEGVMTNAIDTGPILGRDSPRLRSDRP